MKYLYTFLFGAACLYVHAQANTTIRQYSSSDGNTLFAVQIHDRLLSAAKACTLLKEKQGIHSCTVSEANSLAVFASQEIQEKHIMLALRQVGFEETYRNYKTQQKNAKVDPSVSE